MCLTPVPEESDCEVGFTTLWFYADADSEDEGAAAASSSPSLKPSRVRANSLALAETTPVILAPGADKSPTI